MHTQHAAPLRAFARPAALLVLLGLAACDTMIGERLSDTMIGENTWVWFLSPLVVSAGFGGLGMFFWFQRKFEKADLADLVSGGRTPESFALGGWLLVIVLIVAALWFAGYNSFSDIGIPPNQQRWNIGAWCVGTVVGCVVAYLGGRRLAFRRHKDKSERDERKRNSEGRG